MKKMLQMKVGIVNQKGRFYKKSWTNVVYLNNHEYKL